MYVRPLSVIALLCSTNSVALTIPVVDLISDDVCAFLPFCNSRNPDI